MVGSVTSISLTAAFSFSIWLRARRASTREPFVCVELSFLQLRLPIEHDRDRTGRRIEVLRID
jgi:hypothetical protein